MFFLNLRGTSDYCITYNGCSDSICGYVDLHFIGDFDRRRSNFSYVFVLVGGTISWMLKHQNIVALSTTKEEYIVSTNAYTEAIWF